jgi:diguanylate cyclase (GGDEF)-like protein/PAS domain S-box-containing protein
MNPSRILVVEDELVVARDICQQLVALGYDPVGQASAGEDAIRLADELRPDLVLMDIGLASVMDGIAAAQVIRARHGVPIVFLTAFMADDVLKRASLAEPYGYILKPFSERELRTVLEMALYKHQADTAARNQARRNQAILDNMANGVITLDSRGVVASFNKGASVIFGYAPEEVIGCNMSMLMPEPVRNQHAAYLQRDSANPGDDPVVCRLREVSGRRRDGSLVPLSLTVSRIEGDELAYIGIMSDLSEHHQAEETIKTLAFFDDLTGLPNRRRLLERLDVAVTACARSAQHGALIFLDLDHFRRINDTLGPGFGDELLREASRRLRNCVREDDTVSHFGGDEFMVLLDALGSAHQTAVTQAQTVANKILYALCQPYSLRGHHHTSSASVGIVMFDKHAAELDELLKMADAAMYQAKSAGRNTVRFFDPAMQALAVARAEMVKDLQRGLAQQEFVLHYQLQVNAQGKPLGAEALVRWQHPVHGMVPPGQFITLAEETRLVLPLGLWVMEAACKQLRQWAGQAWTAHWTMAVNVSSLQFAQDDFVRSVAQAIKQTGVQPSKLKLELTESMLIGDVQDVIAKMTSLKALGVAFSLDDFGTGYSSLTYLKRLPMDQLKIDQSFVRDLLTDPDDAVISRAIVALGHNMGMQVIAEGVETAGQRDFLASIGCDAFQGYYFGRPMAASELPVC